MGYNYRFKLSDMTPNAWFYKLIDMGKPRKQSSTTTSQSRKKKQSSSTPTPTPIPTSTKHSSKPKQPHQHYNPRKSYHFTRDLNQSDRINTSSPNNQKVLNTTNFHEPPRKSSKQRAKRRTSRTSSPLELEFHDPEFRTDSVLLPTDQSLVLFDEMVSLSNNYSSSCGCRVLHSNNNTTNDDIIIDVDSNSIARKDDKLGGEYDDSFSKLVLPPIVTKPSTKSNDLLSDDAKNNNKKETKPRSRMVTHKDQQHNVKGESGFIAVNDVNRRMDDFGSGLKTLDPSNGSRRVTSSNEGNMWKSDRREYQSLKGSLKVKIVKEDNVSMKEVKNSPGGGRRLRLKINSPRMRSRKSVSSAAVATGGRRSLLDSFAIVKSSFNPQRDFRESMVEMIVQNNIRSSKDLEDLLACYLSLNSDEYHDLIIKVFKQIWFDLTGNQ